ncbi:MAG: hypothetical protein M3R23_00665 [Actinomycetota bacterium]|nr:hypothetical protein [Actinomycetota bacterium]
MLQPRLYRAGLLLALAAAVVLMFSVVSRPPPLRSDVAADAFDGNHAAGLDHQLLAVAPNREPGSSGAAAAADFVTERFRAIQGGSVSEQRFSGDFNGNDVQMRNVSLVLPGLSERRIVIVAPRDCAAGRCAVSSGAATAALLELASDFDGARHTKTLVFVSTDGSVAGAAGARLLAGELQDTPAEAVIVLSQPGSGLGRRPFVVPWSAGPQSASIQLLQSARAAVGSEVGGDPLALRTFPSLFRLAIPSGLQEQAVLIERGADAIGISSAGDRPLPSSQDGLGSLDPEALGGFGRASLSLVFALDSLPNPLEHGPDAYLPLAGKLIPGWALALLAAALLLPVGLVSIDGLAGASRANEPVRRALLWTLGRSIPFLAVLVLAYAMSLVGLIPRPASPFDPQSHSFGLGPALVLVALAAAFVATVVATRRLIPPAGAEEALTPAIGLVIFVSTAAVWLVNPYLALLLVPTAHLWLAAALPELRSQLVPMLVALALGMVVPLVAIGYLGSSLGVGWAVPWQLVLMFTGDQFGLPLGVALCVLGGCLIAIVELATRGRADAPSERPVVPPLGRHAGPGSLGGPPSTSVPGHKF